MCAHRPVSLDDDTTSQGKGESLLEGLGRSLQPELLKVRTDDGRMVRDVEIDRLIDIQKRHTSTHTFSLSKRNIPMLSMFSQREAHACIKGAVEQSNSNIYYIYITTVTKKLPFPILFRVMMS